MSKNNYFVKFLKKINLLINNLLLKYLNKLNLNNLSNITHSNKFFSIFVALIILFLLYLSLPNIYNKAEIRKELKEQLLNNFNLNFDLSQNLNYSFFPRPHFVNENSSILDSQSKISDIKKLKIYVSLNNLFSLENITVKNAVIENANFNLNNQNYNFFMRILNENFKNKILEIKDSKVFYRNFDKEVLFINKIINMKYYYDTKDFKNIAISKSKIFNIPYSLELSNNKTENKILSKININFLKLQIENQFEYIDDIKKGNTNLILNQKKSNLSYEVMNDSFSFDFFDKLKDPKFLYQGKLNFNPFYSNLKGVTEEINLTPLFSSNGLIFHLLKTEIFNNTNLNFELDINANKVQDYPNFLNIFFNSKIEEGLIDIDNTKFSWKNNANLEISDSLMYVKDNALILDGKLNLLIENSNEIYKFLLTPKNYRNKIKKIELNFIYNFDQKILRLNEIKIDNKMNKKIDSSLKKILFKDDKLQNKIHLKNILNEAIKIYAG
jgi:hypothetical protein